MSLCAVDGLAASTSAALEHFLEMSCLWPSGLLNSTELMEFSDDHFSLKLEKMCSGGKPGTVKTHLIRAALMNGFIVLEIGHSVV